MKKKQKPKQRRNKFPTQLTIEACPARRDERIITDAGFETIDYHLALKYFSLEEIFNYWQCYLNFQELASETELEQFEELLSNNDYSFSDRSAQEFCTLLVAQFSWLPTYFDVATARTVYGTNYRWVKLIALQPRWKGLDYIDSYETEAIKLGLNLKQELEAPNLMVINDNKHAVAEINGLLSCDRSFLKNFLALLPDNPPEVFWGYRKSVKVADSLKIEEATRIFAPDNDDF